MVGFLYFSGLGPEIVPHSLKLYYSGTHTHVKDISKY